MCMRTFAFKSALVWCGCVGAWGCLCVCVWGVRACVGVGVLHAHVRVYVAGCGGVRKDVRGVPMGGAGGGGGREREEKRRLCEGGEGGVGKLGLAFLPGPGSGRLGRGGGGGGGRCRWWCGMALSAWCRCH